MKEVNKIRLDLLPAQVLQSLASAFAYGEKYYKRWNWRLGNNKLSTYYAAALRHLTKWFEGQGEGEMFDKDADSGIHHIDAAIASLMILRDLQIGSAEGEIPNVDDDRPFYFVELLKLEQEEG
jgi:hypothetical protein